MTFRGRFGPTLNLTLILTVCSLSTLSAQKSPDPTLPVTPPLRSTRPSAVCGTTIFPGNAALDPKMPRSTPAGTFTMHVVTPGTCRDMSRLPALRNFSNNLPTILGPKR